jgi:hypothetical protein
MIGAFHDSLETVGGNRVPKDVAYDGLSWRLLMDEEGAV